MTITAKIVADSIARHNHRITTYVLEYPRFIHSELLTHRVFSKNSASSRAIPIEKMIQKVIDDPAMPIHWSKNQKGMTQSEELDREAQFAAKIAWLSGRDHAVEVARQLASRGMHKAVTNRVLEPYLHMKVILTATEFDNFFKQRCHPDAQPEIQALAVAMREALAASTPILRRAEGSDWSGWHLPMVSEEELSDTSEINGYRNLVRSAARCARVSYDKVDGGESTFENDLRIFKQLGQSEPFHYSPFEHAAYPSLDDNFFFNLKGWQSLRWNLEQRSNWFQHIVKKVEK
jgi:thymidylate synthase ThyX